jgi:cell division protein FtsW
MMMSQVMVNMMVSTKLMPVTGQNMPLLSMGGTSAWFTCLGFGIVLGVSREHYKEGKKTSSGGSKNEIKSEVEDAIE